MGPETQHIEQLNIRLARRRSRQRFDLLLRAYAWSGAILAILSSGYLAVSFLKIDLTPQQQMALLSAGVGVTLGLMSRALILFRKERDAAELESFTDFESLTAFLATWARFERKSKEALSGLGKEDYNRHSLRSVIAQLHETGRIDMEDVVALEGALQARNAIVHGERSINAPIAKELVEVLTPIIEKIR